MAQTTIKAGSPQAIKLQSVALFAQSQQQNSKLRSMTGKKPTSAETSSKIEKLQSDPGMPIVEIYDLAETAGDTVSMDCENITSAIPIMGEKNAEGKGTKISFSDFELSLGQWTFPVSAGGNLSQQRTVHSLRKSARRQGVMLSSKYWEQRNMVLLAGARGDTATNDWTIPLASHEDFGDVMINPVKAPTYNRHFVVDGNYIVQGGAQLASIDSTDTLKLTHIDQMRNVIDNAELTIQPVKYKGDMASNDSPMWIMLTPANVYSDLLQEGSLRQFKADAVERARYFQDARHPLFAGECGMWNGILVIKITRAVVRFFASSSTNIVTEANKATAAETAVTVNGSLTATHAVERCILLGAQALGCAYGKESRSGYHYSWAEKKYNFDRETEFAIFGIEGSAKVRFNAPDAQGNKNPTDHGVIILDVAARQSAVS